MRGDRGKKTWEVEGRDPSCNHVAAAGEPDPSGSGDARGRPRVRDAPDAGTREAERCQGTRRKPTAAGDARRRGPGAEAGEGARGALTAHGTPAVRTAGAKRAAAGFRTQGTEGKAVAGRGQRGAGHRNGRTPWASGRRAWHGEARRPPPSGPENEPGSWERGASALKWGAETPGRGRHGPRQRARRVCQGVRFTAGGTRQRAPEEGLDGADVGAEEWNPGLCEDAPRLGRRLRGGSARVLPPKKMQPVGGGDAAGKHGCCPQAGNTASRIRAVCPRGRSAGAGSPARFPPSRGKLRLSVSAGAAGDGPGLSVGATDLARRLTRAQSSLARSAHRHPLLFNSPKRKSMPFPLRDASHLPGWPAQGVDDGGRGWPGRSPETTRVSCIELPGLQARLPAGASA